MSIPKNGRFFRFATWKFTELEVQQCLKLLNQTTWGFRTNPNLCIEAQKELTAQHLLVSSNLLTNLDWQTLQLRMFTGISWHPRNLEEFFFVCSIRTFDTFSWSVAPPQKKRAKNLRYPLVDSTGLWLGPKFQVWCGFSHWRWPVLFFLVGGFHDFSDFFLGFLMILLDFEVYIYI
jgi:hypothetical protein